MKGAPTLATALCFWVCLLNCGAVAPLEDRGTTTVDPNTGLEWLDLSLTAGNSYNHVLEGSFTTQQGYRFATAAEVIALFRHAGWSGTDSKADSVAATQALLLLGTTLSGPDQQRSWMLYDPASDGTLAPTHVPAAVFGVRAGEGFLSVPGLIPLRDYSSPEIASALVRLVPEPSSLALLLVGSAYLIARRFKREAAAAPTTQASSSKGR